MTSEPKFNSENSVSQTLKNDNGLVPKLSAEQKRAVFLEQHELISILSGEDNSEFGFDGNNITRKADPTIHLSQEEAYRFLGLPLKQGKPRQHFLLSQGDYQLILNRFGDVCDYIAKRSGDPTGPYTGGQYGVFWDAIQIQVWNKANVGRDVHLFKSQDVTKYMGEYYKGSTLRVFIPDHPKAQAHRYYIVQLLGMKITPTLKQALEETGYKVPTSSTMEVRI